LKANASDLLEFSEASAKQKNAQEEVKVQKGQKFLKMERLNEIWLKPKEKHSNAMISSLINIFYSATLLSSPSKLDADAIEKKKLGFMAKCIVELFGINFRVSYQLGFIYIRQLSLQLRTALIEPSQEHLGQVYSHHFIHCLKLWGLVLSSYCSNFQEFLKDSNSSDRVILSELSNVSFAQLNYSEIEQILNLQQKNQKKNLFREELRPLIYPLV